MGTNNKNLSQPLVSVVTPVYNGEKYLVECIDSVLVQTYSNWELIILNNYSTDRTREIAERYVAKDARIRLHNNDRLLSALQNHNCAVGFMSPESKYCKILHADDWLFPESLSRMVEVAEAYPSVGVVGAYSLVNDSVQCDGLPYPSTIVDGRDICRRTLMREIYPFWSPTSLLIRSDLVRKRKRFYSEEYKHADVEMLYEVLQECDFGFVHQVLTFVREHEGSLTSTSAKPFNEFLWSNLALFVKFSRVFLSEKEIETRREQMLKEYYNFLADNMYSGRETEFWNFHREGLRKVGFPLSSRKLMIAGIEGLLRHPRGTIKTILLRFGSRSSG